MSKLLNFAAQHIWPLVSPFVRKANRCKRCTEKTEQILCSKCNVPDTKYDVLMLLSGGKDSAYILWQHLQLFPSQRVLASIIDTGFLSPVAIPNARRIADRLNVDLVVLQEQVYQDKFKEVIREAFLKLKYEGSGIVDRAEGDLIFRIGGYIADGIAKHYKRPKILDGLSSIQWKMLHPDGTTTRDPMTVSEDEIISTVKTLGLLISGTESPVVSNNQLILTMCAIDILNRGTCSFEDEFAQMVRRGQSDRDTWVNRFDMFEWVVKHGWMDGHIVRTLEKLDLKWEDVINGRNV